MNFGISMDIEVEQMGENEEESKNPGSGTFPGGALSGNKKKSFGRKIKKIQETPVYFNFQKKHESNENNYPNLKSQYY